MRMQLLKIVVVLLVAGSGEPRPQNGADSQAKATERNDGGWRSVQVSSKSHDIVRDDSRYTGTSGSNRKSYITHFRDSADSSRGHNAVGSRASDFAPDTTTARSFGTRRSKIDDIWTIPEFRTITSPPRFSKTDMLSKIARIAAVRNSSEIDRSSPSSGNSKTIQNEKIGWTRFGPNLRVAANYPEKMNTRNLESSKSGLASSENLESVVVQTRYSYSTGSDFLATHASGFEKTNDDISAAVENRQNSNSIRSNSFANKGTGGEMSPWKLEQNRSFLQLTRTNAPSNSQIDAATRSVHKNHNSIRKNVDSIDSKPSVIADSSRRIGGNPRDDLNNSGRSAHGTDATLIPNSKSEVVDRDRSSAFPRGNTVTSHRNFVKLRGPYSTSNRRNVSSVALNAKLKDGNNVDSTGIELRQPAIRGYAQTAARKPVGLNDVKSKPTKNSHASSIQKSSSQIVGGGNKLGDERGDTSVQYLKSWPNEALQNVEDLYNYEKYIASLEDSSHESGVSNAGMPILSSNNYFDHTDPILDSSVKKIIYWLKVPAIVPNDTQFSDNEPTEPVFESIYENLEPNRPLSTYHDNYESAVVQDIPQNQDFEETDLHAIHWSDLSSITRPYATESSSTFTPSSWSDVMSLRNKTVYSPITHVTQNTVVHILNDDLKKPNVTGTQLKAPEIDTAAVTVQTASSGSASESLELAQRPNVDITFTSQKDKDKEPSKQETNTLPSSTSNTNCPTILINTYTRVNNTIQSKEGCTDLNIIVNSHVSSTNVFTPSGAPAIANDQQTSLATQSYGDTDGSEKYTETYTDLSQMDSLDSYVTASPGTYDSGSFESPRPGQHDYYDSQKDPSEITNQWNDPVQSTVEVFQGTQISVSGSSVPLAEATASPAGSSVDGPAVGPGDDASSSAVDPPAAGASASGSPAAGGNVDFENPAQDLPVYLIKPGPVKGQANNGLVPGSLQLPALPNLPSLPIAVKPGLSSSPSLSSTSGSSSSGSLSNDDDDDDDDDFSPGGVLQSITSVFTYFSFLNPMSYGYLSLAAAPFAAMAAGVLGVAAVIFPWALPSVLDFGRSADRTINFVPNLEEFVRRAVHKYDRLNEWKSKRRKRRR